MILSSCTPFTAARKKIYVSRRPPVVSNGLSEAQACHTAASAPQATERERKAAANPEPYLVLSNKLIRFTWHCSRLEVHVYENTHPKHSLSMEDGSDGS